MITANGNLDLLIKILAWVINLSNAVWIIRVILSNYYGKALFPYIEDQVLMSAVLVSTLLISIRGYLRLNTNISNDTIKSEYNLANAILDAFERLFDHAIYNSYLVNTNRKYAEKIAHKIINKFDKSHPLKLAHIYKKFMLNSMTIYVLIGLLIMGPLFLGTVKFSSPKLDLLYSKWYAHAGIDIVFTIFLIHSFVCLFLLTIFCFRR